MKYIAVLDIGTTGVRALVAKVTDNGSTHIIAKASAVSKGIRKFKIDNAEEITNSIRKVVRKIKEQTDIIVNSAYVSIFGSYVGYIKNTASVQIEGEDGVITELDVAGLLDNVESIVLYDNEFLLGALPNHFYLDGRIPVTEPIGKQADSLRVDAQVLTADYAFINAISDCIKNAGITIDGYIPYAEAMRNLIPEAEEGQQSTLLIDVGGSETEYVLYFKKNIFLAGAVPVGGENITNDIAQVLNIKREEADSLKMDYPIADVSLVTNNVDVAVFSLSDNQQKLVKAADIVEIMQARIEDILRIIKDKLDTDDVDTSLIDRVIFAGDGITGFSGLDEVCENILGTKRIPADFSRYTGMKHLYSYASGMVMHVASMLPYGMSQSSIEKVQNTEPVQNSRSTGFIDSVKTKFKDLMDKLRD